MSNPTIDSEGRLQDDPRLKARIETDQDLLTFLTIYLEPILIKDFKFSKKKIIKLHQRLLETSPSYVISK